MQSVWLKNVRAKVLLAKYIMYQIIKIYIIIDDLFVDLDILQKKFENNNYDAFIALYSNLVWVW